MSFTSPRFPLTIGGIGQPIDPDETDQTIIDGQVQERASNLIYPDPGFQSLTNTSIRDIRELVKFHVKNILLCCPEERVWNPGFGVCIRKYLFDQMHNDKIVRNADPGDPESVTTKAQIAQEIIKQFRQFAGHINLTGIDINLFPDQNTMRIAIKYEVDLIITPTIYSSLSISEQQNILNEKLSDIMDMLVDQQGISFNESEGSDDVRGGFRNKGDELTTPFEYYDSDGDGLVDAVRPGTGEITEIEYGSNMVDFL